MESYRTLEAHIGGERVGTLALYQRRLVAFEYADSWLSDGFAISPFSLPLQKKLYSCICKCSFNASCKMPEKLMFARSARSFNHMGIESVFLTDLFS